jgi:lysophospholipase L1-like esterase
MTEYMGNTLESFCEGAEAVNAGIAGSTAQQWTQYTAKDIKKCNSEDGLWDIVYIAVGGNDLLQSGCLMSTDTLKGHMEDAITNIVYELAPGARKYVVTGYCMPYKGLGSDSNQCSKPSEFIALSDAVTTLSVTMPSGSSLEIINSMTACGSSSSSFSDEKFFKDPIHLNSKGYCKVFTQDDVQTALECSPQTEEIDCDSWNTNLYGLNQNCLKVGYTASDADPGSNPTSDYGSNPTSALAGGPASVGSAGSTLSLSLVVFFGCYSLLAIM